MALVKAPRLKSKNRAKNTPTRKRSVHRMNDAATFAACTIISRNYLSHARILAESFRQHHPKARFYVLVVDRLPDGVEFGHGATVIAPEELNLAYFFELCFKYDVTELCTAVKPSLLSLLLNGFGESSVAYFDPDILITRPLKALSQALVNANIVLTPHLLTPIPLDGQKPSELDILRDGSYNLGFIAVHRSDESGRFLKWWEQRLRDFGHVDREKGLFTDQKWIDLVPGMFSGVSILSDDTYNVAYWNIHSRSLTFDGRQYLVNKRPLAFFHFSGFDPRRPSIFSKHQTRTILKADSSLATLLKEYAHLHSSQGASKSMSVTYGYASLSNGIPVHPLLRRLYTRCDQALRDSFGDPFNVSSPQSFFTWATSASKDCRGLSPFLSEVYKARYDVGAMFPNLDGTDRDGFVTWALTQGAKEMGFDPGLAQLQAFRSSVMASDVWRRNVISQANGANTSRHSRTPLKRNGHESYEALIADVRAIVENNTPAGSVIAVANKGDDALLQFAGRRGCNFPQATDGSFPGYYPATDEAAIRHVEDLRGRGIDYLVFPATSTWWLDHYGQLREHLQSHYARLGNGEKQCVIFDVRKRHARNNDQRYALGVNVAGYFASEKGLGEGVRSDVRALQSAGVPFALNNFCDEGSENQDRCHTAFAQDNPYPINLIHINADQVVEFRRKYGKTYFEDRYNIGYWAWELSTFPEKWHNSFDYFQEVWAPSNFVLDAVSRVSPVPVVRIPHCLPEFLPLSSATRDDFGIPSDKCAFLFMFDFHSFLERKNPLGLIEAFRRAFGESDDAVLVLKGSHANPEHVAQFKAATVDENVVIIDTVLSRKEVNSLVSVCDCYVSLHRSEGFGLSIAEAMSLGKPVIATAYSGNMDFMTVANSFPVKYSMVEITENHGPYRKGNVWADPDPDHAAELMRFVYENQAIATDVGRRARQDIVASLHPRTIGEMMRARFEKIATDGHQSTHGVSSNGDSEMPTNEPRNARGKSELIVDKPDPYETLVASIREVVSISVPTDANVLVVSRGDNQLLELGPRHGWHFPQVEEGKYAGHHPASSEDAISHLEELSGRGAQYLLVPNTAFWWLEHYSGLRDYLDLRYRRTWADSRCIIYQLVLNEAQLVADLRSPLGTSFLSARQVASTIQEIDGRVEQQQLKLSELATEVAGIRDLLVARPYMAVDVFQTVDLEKPMGYGLDAADAGGAEKCVLDFADLFRGPEAFIADRQKVYLPFIQGRQTIVDLGCGRGEFLRLMRDSGIPATGVEMDSVLVERLQKQGLTVTEGDAVEYMRERPEESLDAIFSAQVIEHLPPSQLQELLNLVRTRLRPGGLLIAETVNPESIQALKAFSVDLTHQHPIFPQVLLQMSKQAGFPSARIFYPCAGGFTQRAYATAGEYALIALA